MQHTCACCHQLRTCCMKGESLAVLTPAKLLVQWSWLRKHSAGVPTRATVVGALHSTCESALKRAADDAPVGQ